jgi:hypothetical protein
VIDDVGVFFASATRKQRYLDVEAAIAQAQGELGVIPTSQATDGRSPSPDHQPPPRFAQPDHPPPNAAPPR